MRTYFNLPPGCSPADIERQAEEDPQYERAHAEGWLSAQYEIGVEANPYDDNEYLHAEWNTGYEDCDDDVVTEYSKLKVKLLDHCAHQYAGKVCRVVHHDEENIFVWPGRPYSVLWVHEKFIENEWRTRPCRYELEREVERLSKLLKVADKTLDRIFELKMSLPWSNQTEKENAELTGKLFQAEHKLDVLATHFGIDVDELVEELYNKGGDR